MELQRRPDQCLPVRKGLKRKLEEEFDDDPQISAPPTGDARDALLSDVKEQVSLLDSNFSWNEHDRAAAKRATHALADLAKNGNKSSPPPLFPSLRFFPRVSFAARISLQRKSLT